MRKNLMGFKKLNNDIPPKSRRTSKYSPLINKVRETGETYYLDVKDRSKAQSVMSGIKHAIDSAGINNVNVTMRGTTVYVRRNDD